MMVDEQTIQDFCERIITEEAANSMIDKQYNPLSLLQF
jgi:hypothetical protein